MTADKKEELVYKARLTEQCDRNDDLLKTMKEVVELGEPLTVDERNLFSLAFKNVTGSLRSSYRTIDSIEQRLASQGADAAKKETIQLYREKIQAETEDLCKEAVKLVDTFLIPKCAGDPEAAVFLLKMKADYYRYMAEVLAKLPHSNESVEKCQEFYKQAYELAKEKLAPTSPMRLGVALNYSVFFYEIANDATAATQLAKSAFDEGIAEIDNAEDDGSKESVVILQLLRDNLTLWQKTHERGGYGEEEAIASTRHIDTDALVFAVGPGSAEPVLVEMTPGMAFPDIVAADEVMKPSQPAAADDAAEEEVVEPSPPAGELQVSEKMDEQQQ